MYYYKFKKILLKKLKYFLKITKVYLYLFIIINIKHKKVNFYLKKFNNL